MHLSTRAYAKGAKVTEGGVDGYTLDEISAGQPIVEHAGYVRTDSDFSPIRSLDGRVVGWRRVEPDGNYTEVSGGFLIRTYGHGKVSAPSCARCGNEEGPNRFDPRAGARGEHVCYECKPKTAQEQVFERVGWNEDGDPGLPFPWDRVLEQMGRGDVASLEAELTRAVFQEQPEVISAYARVRDVPYGAFLEKAVVLEKGAYDRSVSMARRLAAKIDVARTKKALDVRLAEIGPPSVVLHGISESKSEFGTRLQIRAK